MKPHLEAFSPVLENVYVVQYRTDVRYSRRCTSVFTRTIEPHARTLELPLLVRSGSFFLFLLSQGRAEGGSFRCALALLSKRGNFGRLSARFNYSGSCGTM